METWLETKPDQTEFLIILEDDVSFQEGFVNTIDQVTGPLHKKD